MQYNSSYLLSPLKKSSGYENTCHGSCDNGPKPMWSIKVERMRISECCQYVFKEKKESRDYARDALRKSVQRDFEAKHLKYAYPRAVEDNLHKSVPNNRHAILGKMDVRVPSLFSDRNCWKKAKLHMHVFTVFP